MKSIIGMVYEITTEKGIGYCQYINDGIAMKGMSLYEGCPLVSVFPGLFLDSLSSDEIRKVITKKTLFYAFIYIGRYGTYTYTNLKTNNN